MTDIVHLIADGEAVTFCCGRTPFELPRTDRITVDPAQAASCTSRADQVIAWSAAHGFTLDPWQEDVVRALYRSDLVSRTRRNGLRTVTQAIEAYEANPVHDGEHERADPGAPVETGRVLPGC